MAIIILALDHPDLIELKKFLDSEPPRISIPSPSCRDMLYTMRLADFSGPVPDLRMYEHISSFKFAVH
jgi:hypothetical protein